MDSERRLLDYYLPPAQGFVLESLVATTYQLDFEFLEQELLPLALGVQSPPGAGRAFHRELERGLQRVQVSVLYDFRGCRRHRRLSPRIDPIPVLHRKLHAKLTLLMWVREDHPPQRRVRLLVGSANLTRAGFRENYEYVAALDFGGGGGARVELLEKAVRLIRQMAASAAGEELQRQLDLFLEQAGQFSAGAEKGPGPVELVSAEELLPALQRHWARISHDPPERLVLVSPFWAREESAGKVILRLAQRFGFPGQIRLVCRGAFEVDRGRWLPEFDPEAAMALKRLFPGRVFLQPAMSEAEPAQPRGEQTRPRNRRRSSRTPGEKPRPHRPLHGKMILLEGPAGCVFYVGSANCTRRGLGLGAAANWEAGLVYRLGPREQKKVAPLLGFLGEPVEVLPGHPLAACKPPERDDEQELELPVFLEEVVARQSLVTVRFRQGSQVPPELRIMMSIPGLRAELDGGAYWLLYRHAPEKPPPRETTVDLRRCPRCGWDFGCLVPRPGEPPLRAVPDVEVCLRWGQHVAYFPVRFEDKPSLPLLLGERTPGEESLIDYYLSGREPPEEFGSGLGERAPVAAADPQGVDTRRILSYFIRRFVQALPGMEAEIRRACYSPVALDVALRGPRSPLQLAREAVAGLGRPQAGVRKTPTAVGFQLVEILAVLRRCRESLAEPRLQERFDPVLLQCRRLLNRLAEEHPELQSESFRIYLQRIAGDA